MKYGDAQSKNKDNSFGKQSDPKKYQNSSKNTSDRNTNRLASKDIETKFDDPDDMMKEYLKDNSLDQGTQEVFTTLDLLKELIATKSQEVIRIERELKNREENLAQKLNDLSIDQLEQFSEHVMNKRLDRADNNKISESNFKLDKVHFDYYFEEFEIIINLLKRNKNQPEEEKILETADLRRSQTNRNLMENKNNNKNTANPIYSSRTGTYNSSINKTSENQIVKTLPNENLRIQTKISPVSGNSKFGATTPANTKSPNSINRQSSVIATSRSIRPKIEMKSAVTDNLNMSVNKKSNDISTSNIDSIQNLKNLKNSSSVVKNQGIIDRKGVSLNKSVLQSVEHPRKLERIEMDNDVLMLKNDDDLNDESGFDSDKDNREVYEHKRRERLKSKQSMSVLQFEVLETVQSSNAGDGKTKIQRSLSNLGVSVRNLKNNTRSDSINSRNFTHNNFNNTTKKIIKNATESRDNPSLNKSLMKQSFIEDESNSLIKMNPTKKIEATKINMANTQQVGSTVKKTGQANNTSVSGKSQNDEKIVFQSKLFNNNPVKK